MKYSEAFESLGYSLRSPRQDWTAEKENGVCITIWQSEMQFREGIPWIDTNQHASPYEMWGSFPGNKKRIDHIARALKEFGGYVDVVVVRGVPGRGVEDAFPWFPDKRKGFRWCVTEFDPDTGHFSAQAIEQTKKPVSN